MITSTCNCWVKCELSLLTGPWHAGLLPLHLPLCTFWTLRASHTHSTALSVHHWPLASWLPYDRYFKFWNRAQGLLCGKKTVSLSCPGWPWVHSVAKLQGYQWDPVLKTETKKWKRKTDCWQNHLSGSQDVLLTGFPSARVLPRSLVKTNKTQNKPVSVSVWLRPGCQGCTCLCCGSQHARKGVRNSNSPSLETEVKFPDYVCCSRSFSGLPLALKGVCAQNLRSPFSVAARLAALERRSRKERDQGISGTFFPRTGDLGLLADMLSFPGESSRDPGYGNKVQRQRILQEVQ